MARRNSTDRFEKRIFQQFKSQIRIAESITATCLYFLSIFSFLKHFGRQHFTTEHRLMYSTINYISAYTGRESPPIWLSESKCTICFEFPAMLCYVPSTVASAFLVQVLRHVHRWRIVSVICLTHCWEWFLLYVFLCLSLLHCRDGLSLRSNVPAWLEKVF